MIAIIRHCKYCAFRTLIQNKITNFCPTCNAFFLPWLTTLRYLCPRGHSLATDPLPSPPPWEAALRSAALIKKCRNSSHFMFTAQPSRQGVHISSWKNADCHVLLFFSSKQKIMKQSGVRNWIFDKICIKNIDIYIRSDTMKPK